MPTIAYRKRIVAVEIQGHSLPRFSSVALHLNPGLQQDGHFTAAKSRKTMAALRIISDRTSLKKGDVCRAFPLSARWTALKTRTNFRRNFVPGLSTRIRDLSTRRM
jgi:hypothetical protein